MSNTYKMVTVVGTSTQSYDAAIANALSDATATVRNLSWFEVQEQRGRIVDGKVAEYQIKLQIGFRVEVP
ncbi:MAG: dodecin [Thermoanaerobaculia bacterium]|jgi:flavin-binding protein dodecin